MFRLKDCMKGQIFGPCYKGVTGGLSRPQKYTGNKEDLGSFLCNRVSPASTNQETPCALGWWHCTFPLQLSVVPIVKFIVIFLQKQL